MNILVVLVLLILLGFSAVTTSSEPDGMTSQVCVAAADGVERCGPELVDGAFQLPEEGLVLRSRVDNGPLSPEFQAGYEIQIDADGTVRTEVFAEGEVDNPTRTEVAIGADGVQELLGSLDRCDFFFMPQRSEFDGMDLPVGGGVSLLEVTLEDGVWATSAYTLEGEQLAQFEACQLLLTEEFGIDSPLD